MNEASKALLTYLVEREQLPQGDVEGEGEGEESSEVSKQEVRLDMVVMMLLPMAGWWPRVRECGREETQERRQGRGERGGQQQQQQQGLSDTQHRSRALQPKMPE